MAIVRFYGDLERYGRKFHMSAATASEALRGLLLQIPGLRQHISDDFYRVRIAGLDISESDLQAGMLTPLKDNDVIHIIPRAVGAKNGGIFSFIAGAVMVVVGAFTFYTPWGVPLIAAGVGMMLGGVAMMLTKMPKTNTGEDGASNNNTSFSNLDNAVAQGQPVPLCYGRMMIGSKVLSQGLSTE
ncbi:tail assembly protein [Leminorella grimontii]|uniref:tail assembly protein n=1 Tax=Leminorella grimontii TaxID=82981 RepID=UPI00208454BD|nr:tail assembly protein [Leminorella grimontii]GKX58337.1 tail assembly protein [Leminorella grimontii]